MMIKKGLICILTVFTAATLFSAYPDWDALVRKMDRNMSSESQKFTSKMIIQTRRVTRTIRTVTYTHGEDSSFTEYLSPAREAGNKMLKIDDDLWIYDPDADRTISISGHMLRQSVNGSDLSYEDMMEDETLRDAYSAETVGEETAGGRPCWVLELTARKDDIAYPKRKLWLDKERYLPLKGELYAKSGKLLKRMEIREVMKVGERWYPKEMYYKDALNKKSKGTRFVIEDIEFNADIPEYMFTKAALKK